jgi:hypothetical protein
MLLAQDVARKVMFVQKVIVNFVSSSLILIKKLLGKTGNRCTLSVEDYIAIAIMIPLIAITGLFFLGKRLKKREKKNE